MSVFNLYPTINPTLSFDFVNARALDPSITFTRNTSATYFDETGILRVAGANVPRLDYDPATLAARGFLIEEQRTNLLLQSQALDSGDLGGNTGWYAITRASISADIATAPDGTLTADKIVEDTSTGSHSATNRTTAGSTTNTNPITVTAFVKAAGRTIASILLTEGTTFSRNAQAFFDLTAANATTPSTSGGASAASASIVPVGNGWYRCTLTVTLGGTDTRVEARFYPSISTTTVSYTGDGTSGILLWGAQIEAGAFATSYIPTTTTALTRTADVASVNTLSPWYNATESTLYTELNTFVPTTVTVSAVTAGYDDGTANNRFSNFYSSNTSALAANAVPGGVSITAATGLTLSNVQKQATRFKFADYASSANGAAAVVNTTASAVPTVNTLRIGIRPGGSQANMWLRRVTVYPRGLSNAQLQALTA